MSLNGASERASKNRTQRKKNKQIKIVPETDQCFVTYPEERHAVIFRDFNVAGCAETETYWQTNDDSETDSDDIEIVGAVLKRGGRRI